MLFLSLSANVITYFDICNIPSCIFNSPSMRKQILELLARKSLPPAGIANAIEAEREDISRVI